MAQGRLGMVGLALGHPLGFAGLMAEHGYRPTALVYDEHEAEERERAATLSAQWPGLVVCTSPEEMLSRGIDAVICASQAWRHLDDCGPLLEARVPLFIDKPLAPDLALASAILELTEKHDAPMMSCSVRRFSANYEALIANAQQGRIGTLLFAECFEPHGTRAGYWQDVKTKSGGLLVNYGIHVADPLVKLLGPDIREVHALAAKSAIPEVDSEDTAVFMAQFAGGAIGIGKVSGGYRFGSGKPVPTAGHLIAHGSEGAIQTFIDESDVKVYRGGNFGVDAAYRHKAGDAAAMAAFAAMARNGQRPIPLPEMRAVMAILDAARRAVDGQRS